MDLATILLLSMCILIPYCTVMAVIAIFATRTKWKSAQRILRNVEPEKFRNNPQLNKLLLIYILVSLTMLALLLCGIAIIGMSYLNPSALYKWINFETLQIAMIGFLLLGMIVGAILWIFWNFLEKRFFSE